MINTLSSPQALPPLRVLVCSANLGNEEPDAPSLEALIPPDGNCHSVMDPEKQRYPLELDHAKDSNIDESDKFDLIVFGIQEGTFRETEKGLSLSLVEDLLPSYQRLLDFQRGQMFLMVYSLTTTVHTIRAHSVRAQNTGIGGLPNKGGIVADVQVNNGSTMLSFVTCHLEAHEGLEKYKARLRSIENILKGTKQFAIPPVYPDVSLAFHYCFFLGDLNFRTRHNGRIDVKEQGSDVQNLIQQQKFNEIYEADELKKALHHRECLFGFQTLPCNFPPTFKLERTSGYVYSDQRTPSYTDRILWKTGPWLQTNVQPLACEPIDEFATSDHKPIRAAFQIQLNQPLELQLDRPLRSSFFQRLSMTPYQHPNETESLHIYLSDLEMDIFPFADSSTTAPDSYLCLVTSPQELLMPPRTLWQQVLHAAKALLCCHDGDDPQVVNWPRTSVVPKSLNPVWGHDHELHVQLRAHCQDGNPIELGGALLHLFALKHNGQRGRVGDEVLGSFPINLEYLYRWCLQQEQSTFSKEWNASMESIGETTLRHSRTANPKMVSLDINGPLLHNGLQTGVIRCSLDAWWTKDSLARAARSRFIAKGLASNDE